MHQMRASEVRDLHRMEEAGLRLDRECHSHVEWRIDILLGVTGMENWVIEGHKNARERARNWNDVEPDFVTILAPVPVSKISKAFTLHGVGRANRLCSESVMRALDLWRGHRNTQTRKIETGIHHALTQNPCFTLVQSFEIHLKGKLRISTFT